MDDIITVSDRFYSTVYKPGAYFDCVIHIPEECKNGEPCALLVTHDGLNKKEAAVMYTLASEGKAPYCVTVGVGCGWLPSGRFPGKEDEGFNLRLDCYDTYDSAYGDFIIEELVPAVARKYGVNISDSPDMHMISGGSSGGVSAFNIAFFHSDYFHRVYMSSPSFLSMVKGDEILSLIRKWEPQPLKVYLEYSENEPDDYFGSSLCVAMESERALRFAGYDFKLSYFPGESHCSRYCSEDTTAMYDGFAYLWENYASEPVGVGGMSPRVERVIVPGEGWMSADAFPERLPERTEHGTYSVFDNAIVLNRPNGVRQTVADGFEALSAVALSSEKKRLYAADSRRGCVYAYVIEADGTLGARYLHGALHLATDFETPGALDICVDSDDRVYALTEIAVQTVRSFGLIDVILSLPEGAPKRIAFGEGNMLYVETDAGIWRRRLLTSARTDTPTAAKCTAYYD